RESAGSFAIVAEAIWRFQIDSLDSHQHRFGYLQRNRKTSTARSKTEKRSAWGIGKRSRSSEFHRALGRAIRDRNGVRRLFAKRDFWNGWRAGGLTASILATCPWFVISGTRIIPSARTWRW